MQKLGYIISKTKIRGVADFIEPVSDPSLFYSDKPSLMIGLEFSRQNIKNFSIIKKNPEENKFWTFDKREKRVDFEKDLEGFYNYTLKTVTNNLKYYYVNVFKISRRKVINLLNILHSEDKKWVYIYKDMIYLYHRDYILGISLKLLKYAGLNVKKHLDNLLKNKSLKIVFNYLDLNPYIKNFSKNKKYLIPYFMSLLE